MSRLIPLLACACLASCASVPPVLEEVQRFHPGTEQIEAQYTRLVMEDGSSVKHGESRTFFPDGTTQVEGSYDHGAPDGHWTTWYANGEKAREGDYVSGSREGEWLQWNEQGVLIGRSLWRNNQLNGPLSCFDNSGRPSLSGTYERGKRVGTWTMSWANGGKRLEGRFERGEPTGRWTAWYADGTRAGEGSYHDGQREGLWICWAEDGDVLSRQQFRDDQPVGHGDASDFTLNVTNLPVSDPFDFASIFTAVSASP